MPLYEFVCENCGKELEQLCPMGTDSYVCPACGSVMKKGVSLSDFKMKGTPPKGWKPIAKGENKPKSHVQSAKDLIKKRKAKDGR